MRTGCIYEARIQVLELDYDQSYIGYTINFEHRKKVHLKSPTNSHFHNAIRKYGKENVTWRILEDNIEEHRLPDREELWIAYYDTYNNGLNSTSGGENSYAIAPDVKKKISTIKKAQAERGELWIQDPKNAAQVGAKMSVILKEKAEKGELWNQSEEGKQRMSNIQQDLLAQGKHSSQNPEANAKRSATAREISVQGKHWAQSDEGRKYHSERQKRNAKLGKHPMQQPEVVAKQKAKMEEVIKQGKSKQVKLTPNDVKTIRKEYKNRKTTAAILAKKYNISQGCIFNIIHRRTWKNLED